MTCPNSSISSGSRSSVVLVALCASAFLYVFPYQPAMNNPNENVRYFMTAAIVEHGTYAINDIRSRWGWVNDAAVRDGRVYSVKAPGTSLLGLPGYALYYGWVRLLGQEPDRTTGLWVVRVTASILPTLVFLWFFDRWLRSRVTSTLVARTTVLTVALGSLLYAYAILFVSHTLSAVVAFGAFMILVDARERGDIRKAHACAAGLLAAAVTMFEYPGLVASVALSVYALFALRPRKQLVFFALGALVPTLLVMHFQWSAFGNPFMPGHQLLETPEFRALAQQGVFGATKFHPRAAFDLLFDRGFGLFPLTPVLILAIPGFWLLLRDGQQRAHAVVALVICVGTYVVVCWMNNWRGGWTVGPRYLAVIVPFMAWAAARRLDAITTRRAWLGGAIAIGTTAASFIASGLPSAYYPHVPEPIALPISQLIWPVMRDGLAPANAAMLAGVSGTISMLPLFAVFVVALAWALEGATVTVRQRAVIALAGAGVAVLCVVPLTLEPPNPEAENMLGLVERHWQPRPPSPAPATPSGR